MPYTYNAIYIYMPYTYTYNASVEHIVVNVALVGLALGLRLKDLLKFFQLMPRPQICRSKMFRFYNTGPDLNHRDECQAKNNSGL
jgi:hypothetical protein